MSLASLRNFALVGLFALSSTGCVRKMLIAGQASSSLEASAAFDDVGDLEVVRSAAGAGLAQYEGMHRLSPNNTDLIFLLLKGWTSYGFIFAQDDMEMAAEGSDAYKDGRARAVFSYERAVKFGGELLGHHAEGFEKARVRNDDLRAWLKENFTSKDDAPHLFWTGYAYLARVSLMKERSDLVADLFVPIALVERSIELDSNYGNEAPQVAIASYHARASIGELEEARQGFEASLKRTDRKQLLVQLNYATRYACLKQDRPLFDKLIGEILSFDPASAPQFRLLNTIAQRKVRLAITPTALKACGFEPTPVPKAAGADDDLSVDAFLAPEPPKADPPKDEPKKDDGAATPPQDGASKPQIPLVPTPVAIDPKAKVKPPVPPKPKAVQR